MNNRKTIKALEELAKSEYTTATALDAALTDAEDSNLRRNYRKWRDSHIKQAEALNGRIEELGGHTTRYEFRDGNIYRVFWGLLRGSRDARSLAGVRMVAGRGLKQYVDHLHEIHDPKSLNLLRKNLEAKQDEMRWYDDQVTAEHNHEIAAELEKTREIARSVEKETKDEKEPRRGSPLAAIVVAGAIGAAAYLIARRNEEQDEDASADNYGYGIGDASALTESTLEA